MTPERGLLPVTHHTRLESRGGALQAARTLHRELLVRSLPSAMTFEVRETDDGPDPVRPEDVGPGHPGGAILHLHSTLDWDRLLAGIPPSTPLVVTAHDCALITGGCAHPLDCTRWTEGCPPPCPLGFRDTDAVCARRRSLLRNLAPQLTAPSGWLGKMIRTAIPELRTTVVPNGVPWPGRLMPKTEARTMLGLSPGARVLLFVAHGGIRAAYKSGPMWLEYWKAVKRALPEAVCFMAGGDEAGRDNDLIFWPYVPEDKLHPLMRAADVLAYPTLADNHPLTVLEAMAAGLPTVSFQVGGVPEQIVQNQTGVLVPPGGPPGIRARPHKSFGKPGPVPPDGGPGPRARPHPLHPVPHGGRVPGRLLPLDRAWGFSQIKGSSTLNKRYDMATLDLLTTYLRATPELICVFDCDHRVAISSQAFDRAFGFDGQDLTGLDYDRMAEIRPEHASLFARSRKWDLKALAAKQPATCEEIIARPDGTDGIYEITRTPLSGPDGEPLGLVFSARDITDRIKREFDLRLLSSEQTAIFENAIIGILYTVGTTIHKMNRTMERMTGFNREEIEGEEADRLFPDPGVFASFLEDGGPNLENGESYVVEVQALRRDASPFWSRWSGFPIDRTDLSQGLIWCVDDIDEEKRVQRLRKDTEMIVRHDLKAPLNGVIGFADLIRDMADDQIAMFAGRIMDAGYQMLHLIDHSMDLFKMEEGTFELTAESLDLATLLRDLDQEFAPLKKARNADTVYSVTTGNACPLLGSAPHLKSMFGNLIKNALEASPKDATVDVAITPGDPVRVVIHNKGTVPEDIRRTFFDRYATSGKRSGTGLGTYSARLIARAHGGDVEFTTSDQDGTRLVVTLPANPVPPTSV